MDALLEHQWWITSEHDYAAMGCITPSPPSGRVTPFWLRRFVHLDNSALPILGQVTQDHVHDYARAILTDGMLLLEFRDAIHEGDGNRITTFYKFLMPFFFAINHPKYAIECFRYWSAVSTNHASPTVAAQVKWSRFVNIHGKLGHNVPVDFHMEQLNKVLKRLLLGLGANCNKDSMVRVSHYIGKLQQMTCSLDKHLHLAPQHNHHSKRASDDDEKLIVKELVEKSRIFQFIPGRQHASYPNISSSVMEGIDADKFLRWIKTQKDKLVKETDYKELLKSSTI